jgi:hypothetical protein
MLTRSSYTNSLVVGMLCLGLIVTGFLSPGFCQSVAPDFTLENLRGGQVTLSDSYNTAKTILLFFWRFSSGTEETGTHLVEHLEREHNNNWRNLPGEVFIILHEEDRQSFPTDITTLPVLLGTDKVWNAYQVGKSGFSLYLICVEEKRGVIKAKFEQVADIKSNQVNIAAQACRCLIDSGDDWWFEDNLDGDNLAATGMEREIDLKDRNNHCMRVDMNFQPEDPNKKGEVFFDFKDTPLEGLEYPIDLEGVTIKCRIYVPKAGAGSSSARNGIQLFVKSGDEYSSQYSRWWSMRGDKWFNVKFKPTVPNSQNGWVRSAGAWKKKNNDGSWSGADFDPKRIIRVGVKIALNDEATQGFEGPIYIDDFEIDCKVKFDFEPR